MTSLVVAFAAALRTHVKWDDYDIESGIRITVALQ